MLSQSLLFAFAISYTILSVDGFAVSSRGFLGQPMLIPSVSTRIPSTCLRVQADNQEPEHAEGSKDVGSNKTGKSASSGGETDILSSPAFLKRKIDVLKSDIAKADEDLEALNMQVQQGKAEWGQQLDDLQNEYKNIQARMSKQNSAGDAEATIQVVRKMLDVMDTFDRGFGLVNAETESEKAIEAEYKKAYNMIEETFSELGVTEVKTLGAEFDYEVHQAVMQRPSDEYDEGIVCEELQKGYVLGDKLIRAAMVSVAA